MTIDDMQLFNAVITGIGSSPSSGLFFVTHGIDGQYLKQRKKKKLVQTCIWPVRGSTEIGWPDRLINGLMRLNVAFAVSVSPSELRLKEY